MQKIQKQYELAIPYIVTVDVLAMIMIAAILLEWVAVGRTDILGGYILLRAVAVMTTNFKKG